MIGNLLSDCLLDECNIAFRPSSGFLWRAIDGIAFSVFSYYTPVTWNILP